MLQNAVDPIPEFKQVHTQSQQLELVKKQPMMYESYYKLLISMAEAYDTNFSSSRPRCMSANMHDSYDTGYDPPIDD